MSNQYIIALDLDGTLLNNKSKICFRTQRYLRKLTKKGYLIVLASGRPSHAVLKYYKLLKLNTPIICFNGVYVFSPFDPNFKTLTHYFPKEQVIEIVNKLKGNELENVLLETDNEVWLLKEDKKILNIFWQEEMKRSVGDIETILKKDPMTMVISPKVPGYNVKIKQVVNEYKELGVRFWSFLPFDEIFYKDVTKATAIKYIAEYYGIDRDHIIAFGDGENDIALLKYAKIGVAMKNGTETIFEHASQVSKEDNNHAGIVVSLKHILKSLKN